MIIIKITCLKKLNKKIKKTKIFNKLIKKTKLFSNIFIIIIINILTSNFTIIWITYKTINKIKKIFKQIKIT